MENFQQWDEARVATWLDSQGFNKFAGIFTDNHITGDVLLELNYEALKEMGISSVGERARVLQAIKRHSKLVLQPNNSSVNNNENRNTLLGEKSNVYDEASQQNQNNNQPSLSIDIPPPHRGHDSRQSPSNARLRSVLSDQQQQKYKSKGPNSVGGPMSDVSLVITPRSSSMKSSQPPQSSIPSSAISDSSGPHGQHSKLMPLDTRDVSSPRSASPVSPLAQLMSLGFLPEDKPQKAPKQSNIPPSYQPMPPPSQEKEIDIMEVDHIRARCIRVNGINNQSHIIDVSDLYDAKSIREKIFHKFNITEDAEKQAHAIFAVDHANGENQMINLDDLDLLRICKSQNNPLKAHLTIRKRYFFSNTEQQAQQRRHYASTPQQRKTEPPPQKEKIGKIAKFFGQSKRSPGEAPPPPPQAPPPIPPQFLQQQQQQQQQQSQRPQTMIQYDVDGNAVPTKSKKLLDFFGERPPDELIADQLEQFFPGITQRQSQLLSSKAPSPSHPPKQDIVFDKPRASVADSQSADIKNIVQAAVYNKRMSRAMTRNSVMSRRATNTSERVKTPLAKKTTIRNNDFRIEESPQNSYQDGVTPDTLSIPGTPSTNTLTGRSSTASSNRNFSSVPSSRKQSRIGSEVYGSNLPSSSEPSTSSSVPSTLSVSPSTPKTPSALSRAQSPTRANRDHTAAVSSPIVPEEDDAVSGSSGKESSTAVMSTTSGLAAVAASKRESLPPITNWEQGRMIGQGAFGRVFHGINLDTGEFMAVKQVNIGPENDAQKKKREDALQRELELLQELEHEYIVRYLGFEINPDTFNVFLEYVSGGSVASLLGKFGQFDDDLTRSISVQILFGLEYLHERNIIHRDIKGANILIDVEGGAKISDFGISKKNEYQTAYQRVTRMSMQGSIYWMAPEVAKGKGYSAKVDIWSLGCLVLEMLTGYQPWHKVHGNIIYLLGKGQSPPIPEEVSDQAKDFIKLCFTSDPELRPTATELLSHPFVQIEPTEFNFPGWYEAAAERVATQRALEESSDESDSSYYDESSTYESGVSASDYENYNQQNQNNHQDDDGEGEEEEEVSNFDIVDGYHREDDGPTSALSTLTGQYDGVASNEHVHDENK